MFENETLRKKAADKFGETMRDKVDWIAEHCWTSVLDSKLNEINSIIEAAQKFGVTTAAPFTQEEINQLIIELTALKDLEMYDEARDHLIGVLLTTAKGVDPAVFDKPKTEK